MFGSTFEFLTFLAGSFMNYLPSLTTVIILMQSKVAALHVALVVRRLLVVGVSLDTVKALTYTRS